MDNIEQNIREIASRYNWTINEKNLPKIANAKRRFFGEEDWSRCPCIRRKITLTAVARLHVVRK
jgi:hypothetical protein